MITKIIQAADIHIRNIRRTDEYKEQLTKFISQCKEIVDENTPEKTRIVICGDVLHSKTDISPEGYDLAAWFFSELDKICPTIVFAGNHDVNTGNVNDRLDPLSAIFSIGEFKQVFYIDKELEYKSGFIEDDNIVWCLYSIFDKFKRPDNLVEVYSNPDNRTKTFVGLYHGDLKGAKTDAGYTMENAIDSSYFDDSVDFGLLGHIHKRQCITNKKGVQLVYAGSLIQQDHGERISGHGYVVWNVETKTYEGVDIDNSNNGFYNVSIEGESDIEEDKEEFVNL